MDRWRWGVLAAAVIASVSCGQDTLLLNTAPPVDTTGGGGQVQRATLTISFRLGPDDSSVASALGWTDGAVPAAEVTLERPGEPATRQQLTTDSSGVVRLDRLLTGEYRVSMQRVLSLGEKARLGPGDADVDVVAAGEDFGVTAPATARALDAYAGRRGSLVISEVFNRWLSEGNPYFFATWIELYNNSDTVIYLDGKLVGEAAPEYEEEGTHSCADYVSYATDSLGLWAPYVEQFPGTGRQYPLGPGQAVLIAQDAIDHRPAAPGADDLSRADFEMIGDADLDVDNPAVPNMITRGGGMALGHGLWWSIAHIAAFVADQVDLDTLPTARPTYNMLRWRLPNAVVLDVALFMAPSDYGRTPCRHLVPDRFEHQPARIIPESQSDPRSLSRKVLEGLAGCRLQRTRNSARDFVLRWPRTPGTVP